MSENIYSGNSEARTVVHTSKSSSSSSSDQGYNQSQMGRSFLQALQSREEVVTTGNNQRSPSGSPNGKKMGEGIMGAVAAAAAGMSATLTSPSSINGQNNGSSNQDAARIAEKGFDKLIINRSASAPPMQNPVSSIDAQRRHHSRVLGEGLSGSDASSGAASPATASGDGLDDQSTIFTTSSKS